MIHVTCRLTAKNRNQLQSPEPSLGNRVWATFYFLRLHLQNIYDFSELGAIRGVPLGGTVLVFNLHNSVIWLLKFCTLLS